MSAIQSAGRISVTFRDAALLTGLSVSTLRRAARRGELPIVTVGSARRIRLATLNRWMAAQEHPAAGDDDTDLAV